MIAAWISRRRALHSERQWMEGYDFAAGRMLRGESIGALESLARQALDFDSSDSFDEGIIAAVRDFSRITMGERNERT